MATEKLATAAHGYEAWSLEGRDGAHFFGEILGVTY